MSGALDFVLLNEGTSASSLTGEATAAWLATCAAACEVQLNRHFAPYWGGTYLVRAGSGSTDVLPGEIVFALVDSLPDAPGAIAYHDVNGNAVPVGFLALNTCNSLNDVSMGTSHELLETGGDPEVNLWADAGNGTEYAREVCDAVESSFYVLDGIRLSDFVTPAFFAPNATGPYSYMAAIDPTHTGPRGPFLTAAGGYQISRSASSTTTQVNGAIILTPSISVSIPFGSMFGPHKLARKRGWNSRTYRRGVRL